MLLEERGNREQETGDRGSEHEEAAALQQQALARLTFARHELIFRCREAMRTLYWRRKAMASSWENEQPYVNGDDATRWLDYQGCEEDRRLIGAVFRPNSGWAFVCTVKSELKRRHHRRISCWRWVGE